MSTPPPQNVDPLGDDEVADVDDAPAQALREAMSQLGELRDYVGQYVAAKLDLARLSLRKKLVAALVGILALIVAVAAVVTLTVLLLSGMAQLVASWLGGRAWAGDLIVGGGLLLALVGVCWIGIQRISGTWRDATVKRYELRHAQQRTRFGGHDAEQRGAEFASKASDGK